ncbi:MAG: alpha/beta hydrolase family protein [Gammaproteobacteria bacterium]|nr:alpha/beta hydrolase family protein [Gammaproteobacteria bacterium]
MMLKTFIKPGLVLFILLAVSTLTPVAATNSDVAKESRWAEQVIDGLLDGDELWLIDDIGHEFLSILTEGDESSGRAVVLVHGIGVHPNWPDVIYPLRAGLLEQGITTLSLQMPILANDADEREYGLLFPEVPGRFEAALDYLDDEGYKNVTIVGHSMGASMATYYLSQSDTKAVDSLVIIGMVAGGAYYNNLEALPKVRVPVLDLYGSEDLERVLNSVDQRATSGKKQSVHQYLQVRVDGANHFFQGHEDSLVRQVAEWLDAHRN